MSMETVAVIVHVVIAIVLLGPLTIGTALFPRYAETAAGGDQQALGTAKFLADINRRYTVAALLVPVLGVAAMATDFGHFITQGWIHISLTLVLVAWLLLAVVYLPNQKKALEALGVRDEQVDAPLSEDAPFVVGRLKGALAASGGVFALLWVLVAIVMYWKPLAG